MGGQHGLLEVLYGDALGKRRFRAALCGKRQLGLGWIGEKNGMLLGEPSLSGSRGSAMCCGLGCGLDCGLGRPWSGTGTMLFSRSVAVDGAPGLPDGIPVGFSPPNGTTGTVVGCPPEELAMGFSPDAVGKGEPPPPRSFLGAIWSDCVSQG